MYDNLDQIYFEYKKFIENRSNYKPRVVKYYTSTSTYFPIISCTLTNNTATDHCTNDKIEQYEAYYYTINIYAKDKTEGANVKVASQVIVDELVQLTIQFFGEKLNMKKTLNQPTPNADTSIFRQTLRYQCLIGNVRGNIIRQ
jgi:hypothetical protein